MANAIALKSLKFIEWTVLITKCDTYTSRVFPLYDRTCRLLLSITPNSSCLYLKSNEEIQLPVTVTIRVSNPTVILCVQGATITSTNSHFWYYSRCLTNSLTFEIMIHGNPPNVDKSVQISSYKDACFSMENLSQDFSKLLEEGPNHDVEFTVGEQTIKAHKNILCARSNVFASMLQSDMLEGKTGHVAIQDMDATIFQQFLKCLYTGKLPELTVDSAFQLYETSDKYNADGVKKQCADFLIDNLSAENFHDILVLSDRHSDEDFKKKVIKFLIKEKIPYMGQKWKNFCKENPILAVEVYSLFCEQFCSQ